MHSRRLAENFVQISLLHNEIKTFKVECLCGLKIEIPTICNDMPIHSPYC